ncbi:MAG: LLM class flavin-dependent oxidoreductase [Frankia sp.]|nr:LLM class flavin-dependent oxidoreductase [Frankia sp.]
MRFGLPWPGPQVAREAEAAGVAAFCTGDFVDNDAYMLLAEMAANTTTAMVGTGIAYAFSRTPYAHASAIRTLHRMAPGRLFLGLGSGAYSINRDWFGVPADRPAARMVDLAAAVRAWLRAENGQRVRHDGPHFRVDARVAAPVLGRLDVPLLFAGFNRGMVAAAARHADGLIGHGLFTARWWADVIRPAAAGAPDGWLEHGWLITAVDDEDPARAVLEARRMIAFYLTVKTYDPFVAYHGWQDAVAEIRAAFARGDVETMANAVTDEMADAIAVCGTTAQARERLATRRAEGSLARDLTYLAFPTFLTSVPRRAVLARNSLALVGE